jgi:hypothetical protein
MHSDWEIWAKIPTVVSPPQNEKGNIFIFSFAILDLLLSTNSSHPSLAMILARISKDGRA